MRGISKIYRESFWTKKSLETIGFKAFYVMCDQFRCMLKIGKIES